MYNLHSKCLMDCLNDFLLCGFEATAGWIDVHAQFNGGEPQRLKVRCLGVTLRGRMNSLNSIMESTPKTQGGWNTFGINVQRSTRGEYHSLDWNKRTTKTWRAMFGSTTCSSGSICWWRCWDQLKISSKVWFRQKIVIWYRMNAPSTYNNCVPLDEVIQTSQTTSPQHSPIIHVFPLKRLNSC